jgi:hypothetical protein
LFALGRVFWSPQIHQTVKFQLDFSGQSTLWFLLLRLILSPPSWSFRWFRW